MLSHICDEFVQTCTVLDGWDVRILSLMCDEGVVESGGEGDREDVSGDVFDGEVAAEKDLSGESEAEGVDGCDGDEAVEFDEGGDEDGDCGEGWWAEFGEDRGEEPVESYGPESGAKVFVEEPGEVEWEEADGQACGDGDEQKKRGDRSAAARRWKGCALSHAVDSR